MNLELLLSLQAKAWEVARDKSRGGWGCSFHAPHFYIFIVGSRRIGNALHNGAKAILKWYLNCFTSLRFHDFLMGRMELKIDLNISREICWEIEIWIRLQKDLAHCDKVYSWL